MPLYLIERNYAEQIPELTTDTVDGIQAVNGEEQVRWVLSFLSADLKKSYCLYEAAEPESIRAAARRANVPADVIVEVSQFDPQAVAAS